MMLNPFRLTNLNVEEAEELSGAALATAKLLSSGQWILTGASDTSTLPTVRGIGGHEIGIAAPRIDL
jgi:hypothetical protein